MLRRNSPIRVLLLIVPMLVAVFAASLLLAPTEVARGKSAAIPLSDELTPEQQAAQELALADPRVQAHTIGQRTEVFGVSKFLDINTEVNALGCSIENCLVVNIFNFDAAATVQAFVRLDIQEVVEIYYQPGLTPRINQRLADRALELAVNAPEVIQVLDEQRVTSDWAPMETTIVGSDCERGHLCVASMFDMGDYILWAIVDLTDDVFLDTFWTATDGTPAGLNIYPDSYVNRPDGGCPMPGSASRNGWTLDFNTTAHDGLNITNVRFNDALVIKSAKLAEWHADYGTSGFQDYAGCGPGSGPQISPVGETQVVDLIEDGQVVGFEVVQDFRMGSWGSGCNYRYDQHFQFYSDGRFRTVQGAYGKGCGTNSLYRGLMRIDLAAGGTEGNDNIEFWNGSDWQAAATETRWCPEGATDSSCTGLTPGLNPDGYRFRIVDSGTGDGYYLEPGRGQFSDEGESDNEFVYALAYRDSEGDGEIGRFNAGCCNDYNHGPEVWVNGESITDANLVLWYVPQMQTDATAPDYYCWTVTGEPNPETYPCFSGPMFVPLAETAIPPTASFTFPNEPNFPTDTPIQFTDTSEPGVPNTLTWAWDFGDGGSSTQQNPLYAYDDAGTYDVTLTVDNGVFSDTFTAPIEITAPPTAVTLGALNAGTEQRGLFFAAGLALLAGAGIALRRK